jgi:hypothetical protein
MRAVRADGADDAAGAAEVSMSSRSQLALALCASATILALATGTAAATAERLLLSAPGEVTFASIGKASFTAGETVIRCNLSLTGSFQSAIAQTRGATIASITRATTSACEGGESPSVTFLSTPWSLTYSSFSGTQPEAMTGVLALLNGVSANVRSGFLSCLYRGEVGVRFAVSGSNPYRVGTVSTLANSLALVAGAFCPSTGSVSGSFSLSRTEWFGEVPPMLTLHPSANMISRELTLNGQQITFTNTETNEISTGALRFDRLGWSMSDTSGCAFRTLMPNKECPVTLRAEASAPAAQLEVLSAGGTRIGLVMLVTP